MQLEILVPAVPLRALQGPALRLIEPISFWGGVSPVDGTLTDPLSEHRGRCIANRVVFIQELRGSSSGSSVLLELIYKHIAPSAIILAEPDAILALGVLIAAEMHWPAPGIFKLPLQAQLAVANEAKVSINIHGNASIHAELI